MTPDAIKLVQDSFAKVVPIAPQAAAQFYQHLFTMDAGLQPLFKGDMEAPGRKLMEMIGTAVSRLNNLDMLIPVLPHLGKRHVAYGAEDTHYATVGSALLLILEQGFGAEFTPPVKDAWTTVYGVMAQTLVAAAKSSAN